MGEQIRRATRVASVAWCAASSEKTQRTEQGLTVSPWVWCLTTSSSGSGLQSDAVQQDVERMTARWEGHPDRRLRGGGRGEDGNALGCIAGMRYANMVVCICVCVWTRWRGISPPEWNKACLFTLQSTIVHFCSHPCLPHRSALCLTSPPHFCSYLTTPRIALAVYSICLFFFKTLLNVGARYTSCLQSDSNFKRSKPWTSQTPKHVRSF